MKAQNKHDKNHLPAYLAYGLAGLILLMPQTPVIADSVTPASAPPSVTEPIVKPKVSPKLSKPVREMPPAPAPTGEEVNPLQWDPAAPPVIEGPDSIVDPAAQFFEADSGSFSLNQLGNPIVNVPGQGGSNPNDTNGDVGRNDYVQMINSQFRIYDKQGVPRGPAAAISTLWTSANPADTSECATQNAGDPVVLYDNLADRWLLSQFARSVAPAPAGGGFICIAISQTADPTGAYYLYQFQTQRFPDYYKIGAWPDGYYISANLNGPNTAMANVYDRANMLNGNPAGSVQFEVSSFAGNFDTLIPSDVDGSTNPPVGTPNFMYRPHDTAVASAPGPFDNVEIWEFHVDWVVPANSTLNGPTYVQTAEFNSTTCGYVFPTDCIPQPGTATLITAIPLAGMFRFPYRNYGDREVLAGNFTVDANGADGVGIRWFILERSGGGAWTVANEGTYAPQPVGAPEFVHRWMGSVAMDRFGNLALGHSRSSSQHPTGTTGFPSAYYTGRLASDPNGLLPQPEILVRQGQSPTGSNRWGDYFAMTVDPVDDCTFWYTGDSTGAGGFRQSSIASFRFTDCATDLEISKTATASPSPATAGGQLIYTVTVQNHGPLDAANVIVIDTLPAGVVYQTDTDSCIEAPAGTLTCNLGSIASGDSTAFDIKVLVDSDLTATSGPTVITNTAVVSSDQADSDTSNNTVSLNTIVEESADLQLTKQCKPDGAAPTGSTATCTIFVDNLGLSDARNVVVTDTHLSNGSFTISSATFTPPPNSPCGIAGGVVTCNLGIEPAGGRTTITVQITSNDAVDVNDTATVASATLDPNTSNNIDEGSVRFTGTADLSLTKTDSPDPVVAGTNLTYVLTATNNGPSSAPNVVVEDLLPAEVSLLSATPSQGSCSGTTTPGGPTPLTCNLGSLANAAATTVTVIVKVNQNAQNGTILVNNANVSSDYADANNGNNNVTATTTVNTAADLAIVKTADKAVYKPSSLVTYTVNVRNNGSSDARQVVVTDNLPILRQAIYQSDTGGCVRSATTPTKLTCNMGNIPAGEFRSFQVYMLVKGTRGKISNNVTVLSNDSDPDPGNDSSTIAVTIGK